MARSAPEHAHKVAADFVPRSGRHRLAMAAPCLSACRTKIENMALGGTFADLGRIVFGFGRAGDVSRKPFVMANYCPTQSKRRIDVPALRSWWPCSEWVPGRMIAPGD